MNINLKIIIIQLVLAFVAGSVNCRAQINIQCNGPDNHSIYLLKSTMPKGFYRIDSIDTNPTNPILLTPSIPSTTVSGGISINANLNIPGPETMYYVSDSGYYYWNGAIWTHTGHYSGHIGAVNPGGTSNYIFNLYGFGNSLYRYDGTSNGTQLLSNLNVNGTAIWDVATDNQGNFYILYTNQQMIIQFDPNGFAIDTFSTSGNFTGSGQTSFAIVGSRLYAINGFGALGYLYEGIKTGTNINFTHIKTIPFIPDDIASCPNSNIPLSSVSEIPSRSYTIFPNPATSYFKVYVLENDQTQIFLYDVTLQLVVQKSFYGNTRVDTERLSRGAYLYEIRNKNGPVATGKVFIH